MTDAGFTSSQLDTIRFLIQAQADAQTSASPQILLRPGTVQSYVSATRVATVLMDGDPLLAIPVQNIVLGALTVGLRVVVLFQRPHGAFVIGFG